MNEESIQFVGLPCGHHGNYTFYKAFKYRKKSGHTRILCLGEFFFVKIWPDSDLLCIGELQLLWDDKNEDKILSSLRLYFLPENTPEGRIDDNGDDEVFAISEKVVMRVSDLLQLIPEDETVRWERGLNAVWEKECSLPSPVPSPEPSPSPSPPLADWHNGIYGPCDGKLDFRDVYKEKQLLGCEKGDCYVLVLSYARYCRYRAILKQVEGVADKWLRNSYTVALGGFCSPTPKTKLLFCRETFEYPELEDHELLCNHLAPKLTGRPRKKRTKRSVSPSSESNESESSSSTSSSLLPKSKPLSSNNIGSGNYGRNGLRRQLNLVDTTRPKGRPSRQETDFLEKLHTFMKGRKTPIERVPHLGFKKIDIFFFFNKVQNLGGYDAVTSKKMWKHIYDELGGHPGNTSAATCTRRHYEKLLLPYERKVRGEEDKPMPPMKKRRLELKNSTGDSEGSNNGNGTDANVGESSREASNEREQEPIDPNMGDRKDHFRRQLSEDDVKPLLPLKLGNEITIRPASADNLKRRVHGDGLEVSISVHRPPDLKLQDLMASTPGGAMTGQSALQDLAKIASRIDSVPQDLPVAIPKHIQDELSITVKKCKAEPVDNYALLPSSSQRRKFSLPADFKRRPSVIHHTQQKPDVTLAIPQRSHVTVTPVERLRAVKTPTNVVQSLCPYVQTNTVYGNPKQSTSPSVTVTVVEPSVLDLSVRKQPQHQPPLHQPQAQPQILPKSDLSSSLLDLSVRKRPHTISAPSPSLLGSLKSSGIRIAPSVEIKPVQNPAAVAAVAAASVPPPVPVGSARTVGRSSRATPVAPIMREPSKPSSSSSVSSAPTYVPYFGFQGKPSVAAPQPVPTYAPPMWPTDPASYYASLYGSAPWYPSAASAPPQFCPPMLSEQLYKEFLQRGPPPPSGPQVLPPAYAGYTGYPAFFGPLSKDDGGGNPPSSK